MPTMRFQSAYAVESLPGIRTLVGRAVRFPVCIRSKKIVDEGLDAVVRRVAGLHKQ